MSRDRIPISRSKTSPSLHSHTHEEGSSVDDYLRRGAHRQSTNTNTSTNGWFGRIKSYAQSAAKFFSRGEGEEDHTSTQHQTRPRRSSVGGARSTSEDEPDDQAMEDTDEAFAPVNIPGQPHFTPIKFNVPATFGSVGSSTQAHVPCSFAASASNGTPHVGLSHYGSGQQVQFGSHVPQTPLSPQAVAALSRTEKERLFHELQKELVQQSDESMEEKENHQSFGQQGFFSQPPPFTPSTVSLLGQQSTSRKRSARSWEQEEPTSTIPDTTPRKQGLLFSPYGKTRPSTSTALAVVSAPSPAQLGLVSHASVPYSTVTPARQGALGSTSTTASRILDTLDRMGTPLLDAKKIRLAPSPKPILALGAGSSGAGSSAGLNFAPSGPSRRASGAPQHLRPRFDPMRRATAQQTPARGSGMADKTPAKRDEPTSAFKITVSAPETSANQKSAFGGSNGHVSFISAHDDDDSSTSKQQAGKRRRGDFGKVDVQDEGEELEDGEEEKETTSKSSFTPSKTNTTASFGGGFKNNFSASTNPSSPQKSAFGGGSLTSLANGPPASSSSFTKNWDSSANKEKEKEKEKDTDMDSSDAAPAAPVKAPERSSAISFGANSNAADKSAPVTSAFGFGTPSAAASTSSKSAEKSSPALKPAANASPFKSLPSTTGSGLSLLLGNNKDSAKDDKPASSTTTASIAGFTVPATDKDSGSFSVFATKPTSAARESTPPKVATTAPAKKAPAPVKGDCPVCGMDLEDVDHSDCQDEAGGAKEDEDAKPASIISNPFATSFGSGSSTTFGNTASSTTSTTSASSSFSFNPMTNPTPSIFGLTASASTDGKSPAKKAVTFNIPTATTPAKESTPSKALVPVANKKAPPPKGDCPVCGMDLEDVDHSDCQDDGAAKGGEDDADEEAKPAAPAVPNPFATTFATKLSSESSSSTTPSASASSTTSSISPAKPAFGFASGTAASASTFGSGLTLPGSSGSTAAPLPSFAFGSTPAPATTPATDTGFSFSAAPGGFSAGVNSKATEKTGQAGVKDAPVSTPAPASVPLTTAPSFGAFGTPSSSGSTSAVSVTGATSLPSFSNPAASTTAPSTGLSFLQSSSLPVAPSTTTPTSSTPSFGFSASASAAPISSSFSSSFGTPTTPAPQTATAPPAGLSFAPSNALKVGSTGGLPSFGSSAPQQPSTPFGAPSSAPSFGSTPSSSAPSFGGGAPTPQSGFAPSGGVNAISGSTFGAAQPSSNVSFSTTFGSQPSASPSPFNIANSGASTPSFGFSGSAAPQQPTSSFGGGAVPQQSPSFQQQPSQSSFGAPSFGGGASPFGGSNQLPQLPPSSSFLGGGFTQPSSSNFGGPPSSGGFSAPPSFAPPQQQHQQPQQMMGGGAPQAAGGFTAGTRTIVKVKRKGGA